MHLPREHINIDLTLLVLVDFDVWTVVELDSRVAPVFSTYEHIDAILAIFVHILYDGLLEDFVCRALVTHNLSHFTSQEVVVLHLILFFLLLDVFHLPLGFLVALSGVLVLRLSFHGLILNLFMGFCIDSISDCLGLLKLFGAFGEGSCHFF